MWRPRSRSTSATPSTVTDLAMTIATSFARGSLDSDVAPGFARYSHNRRRDICGHQSLADRALPCFRPRPMTVGERHAGSSRQGIGIVAAWLTLPLARRHGPGGPASLVDGEPFGAFGTAALDVIGQRQFLLPRPGRGHRSSTLAALLEWRGRRRPWGIGHAIGLACLAARPTILLAAIPFAVALISWTSRRQRLWRAAFGLPLALAVGVDGARRRGPLRLALGHWLPGSPPPSAKACYIARAKGETSDLPAMCAEHLRFLVAGGFDFLDSVPLSRP